MKYSGNLRKHCGEENALQNIADCSAPSKEIESRNLYACKGCPRDSSSQKEGVRYQTYVSGLYL